MHSTNSDGVYQVDELINKAIELELDIISITDHDTLNSSIEASDSKLIKIIIGLELSTFNNGESVHILGYFNNNDHTEQFLKFLDNQLSNRKNRALEILEKLKMFNINLNPKFINEGKSITRGNIAAEIIKQGYNYTKKEIFRDFIGVGCPAYLPSLKTTTVEGIKSIHDVGGLAVLAHPMLLKKNNVEDILKLGVDGIEARYPNHLDKEDYYRQLAKKYNVFITAGSDFHSYDDGMHGNLGDVTLSGNDLKKFLRKLNER
jgi:predicted metal-dependent phosphoesterase TrpH